jgi:hypothetical protein
MGVYKYSARNQFQNIISICFYSSDHTEKLKLTFSRTLNAGGFTVIVMKLLVTELRIYGQSNDRYILDTDPATRTQPVILKYFYHLSRDKPVFIVIRLQAR